MPNAWNVVVHVDITFAIRVVQPDSVAAYDVHRIPIEERSTLAQEPSSPIN
jgi:hypothetical protein